MDFAYSSPEARRQAAQLVRSFAAEMNEKYAPAPPPPKKGWAKLWASKDGAGSGSARRREGAANDR